MAANSGTRQRAREATKGNRGLDPTSWFLRLIMSISWQQGKLQGFPSNQPLSAKIVREILANSMAYN
jgi:hypothetical protein